MPSSDDEEAHFGVPVEENPSMQEEESKGEQGPILTRSALKRQRINQPQTTMTQYIIGPTGRTKEQEREHRNGSIPLEGRQLAVHSSSHICYVALYTS